MKTPLPFLLACCLCGLPAAGLAQTSGELYELRTETARPGKLEALHSLFREQALTLFAGHGVTTIGCWTPQPNAENTLVCLLRYPGREAREQAWKALQADPQWKAALSAAGDPVATVTSQFLTMTNFSPALRVETQAPARLFELRRYTTHPGKLPLLDARFRNHTLALFEKHGMTNVVYFHLTPDQEASAHTLVYFLAHRDDPARIASFAAFRADPVWLAARAASETDGKLTVEGGVLSTVLLPTDYSPLR